jgi:hypothetical protein
MAAAPGEKVRLDAAMTWLDRAEFKPAERHEHRASGDLTVAIDRS